MVPIGGRARTVRRYLVTVQIATGFWTIPVCQHSQATKMQCTLIGQDLLYFFLACLDGKSKELRLDL